MRLTRASDGMAIEKPESARISGDGRHRLPILLSDPAILGLPLIRDQQHVLTLHWKLIEQQHMATGELFHLQRSIPWQEWIRPWSCFPQVSGYRGNQLPQQKRLKARKLEMASF